VAMTKKEDRLDACFRFVGFGEPRWNVHIDRGRWSGLCSDWCYTIDEAQKIPSGIKLISDKHGLVTEIFVTGSECLTSKGLRVGDSQKAVRDAYGNGEKGVLHMKKGSTSQWAIGDFILQYRGVEFVISKGKVDAIVIKKGHP